MTIIPFEYPAGPETPLENWDIWDPELMDDSDPDEDDEIDDADEPVLEELSADFERRLQEETQRSFEAGRQHGVQEGRAIEREAQGPAVANLQQQYIQQLSELVEKFGDARERYLHMVEQEVVRLALAVAARILRREAQMDPLLLLGAVRVALGQLSASTQVRLRVPPSDAELWSEAIALLPKLSVKPEILTGEKMRLGDCVIETEMGSVDLGVRAQLNEIERGFFDRTSTPTVETAPPPEHNA